MLNLSTAVSSFNFISEIRLKCANIGFGLVQMKSLKKQIFFLLKILVRIIISSIDEGCNWLQQSISKGTTLIDANDSKYG